MNRSEIWGPAADRILVVGLTGGIASGKTEVADELSRLGARVVDADEVTRLVTSPGTVAYRQLVEKFGGGILDDEGKVDRTALSRIVFGDASKRQLLNSITHPEIFKSIIEDVKGYSGSLKPGDAPVIVIDAALIVDVGLSDFFDLVVLVSADEEVRLSRLLEKRGMTEKEAWARISSQVPDSKRRENSDIVIENDGSLDKLRSEVRNAWGEIIRRAEELHP